MQLLGEQTITARLPTRSRLLNTTHHYTPNTHIHTQTQRRTQPSPWVELVDNAFEADDGEQPRAEADEPRQRENEEDNQTLPSSGIRQSAADISSTRIGHVCLSRVAARHVFSPWPLTAEIIGSKP